MYHLIKSPHLFFCIACIFLLSCDNKNGSDKITVSPESSSVSGDLREFVRIIKLNYTLSDNSGVSFSVRVESIKTIHPQVIANKDIKVFINFLRENGAPISDIGEFQINKNSKERLVNLLKNGNGHEILHFDLVRNDKFSRNHLAEAKHFIVSSILLEEIDVANKPQASQNNDAILNSLNKQKQPNSSAFTNNNSPQFNRNRQNSTTTTNQLDKQNSQVYRESSSSSTRNSDLIINPLTGEPLNMSEEEFFQTVENNKRSLAHKGGSDYVIEQSAG